MLRAISTSVIAAISLVLAFQSTTAPPPAGCPDIYPEQPLVIFQTNGYTLAGKVHFQLSAYSSGLVSISSVGPFGTSKADSTYVPVVDVQNLHTKIVSLGGLALCDDPSAISDVPLNTVTVFRTNTTTAAAHTFSYFGGNSGAYAAIESLVSTFAATQFPNF